MKITEPSGQPQPAPGVNTGILRNRDGAITHESIAVTLSGIAYRGISVSGPCPVCGLRLCYGSAASHVPTHKGPPHVKPGDLAYCPKCKACNVVGEDLGLTRCPDPTDPEAQRELSACIGYCKVAFPNLYATQRPPLPAPSSSPAQAFAGVRTRAAPNARTTHQPAARPTRDSERRDIA